MKPSHQDLILDQFTRQAIPFSTAKTIADEKALQLLLEVTDASAEDTVLDVACGGGNVVCAFAPVVSHATGIDMTPAMLERAARMAAEKRLSNVTWQQGDVTTLPWPDASFSIVVTRFSFHHFPDPLAVLGEMKRVCKPGGHVLVADMHTAPEQAQADAFNRMEVLRDPSHVRALHLRELKALFPAAGFAPPREDRYELRDVLENLLARSFPNPGDDDRIRNIFRESAQDNRLGIPIRIEGADIHYAYPVAVLTSVRP